MRKIKLRSFFLVVAVYLASGYLLLLFPDSSGKRMIGNDCLPNSLKGKVHNDYKIVLARAVPRSATSLKMVEPPIGLIGDPVPIPKPGHLSVSVVQVRKNFPIFLPYLACTTKSGLHFRIGARWDNNDHYYTFPSLALKEVN